MKTSENRPHSTERKGLRNLRIMAAAALLAAASMILASLAKSIFGTGPLRVTFENLPIFLGSIALGPTVGAAIALCADLLSCLLFGMAPNPIITAGTLLLGLLPGLLFRYALKGRSLHLRVILSVLIAHVTGSMVLKTVGLYAYFGDIVFFRIPIYLGIAALESLLLLTLLRNRAFVRQLERTSHYDLR